MTYQIEVWEHPDDGESRIVEQLTVGNLHEVGGAIDDLDRVGRLDPPNELRLSRVNEEESVTSDREQHDQWTEELGSATDGGDL